MLLAVTGDGLLSQNPFLVATIRISSEKLLLDDVKESSFSNEFSVHFYGLILYMVSRLAIVYLFYASV